MFQYHDLHIIGFDLGRGEMALSQINMPAEELDSKTVPSPLLIHHQISEVTAIAEYPDRGITLFGEAAIRHPRVRVVEFQITSKTRLSRTPTIQRAIVKLVKAVYEYLINERRLDPNAQNYFFVGCPSNWDEREIKLYTQLMQKAGLPHVKVVKESYALLMEAKYQLTQREIEQSVLVVDLGSSTTDYTLVGREAHISIALEIDLGTSQIDKAILKQTLASYDDRARLEEIFEEQPLYREHCELSCRRAREEYFSNPENYQDEDTEVSVGAVKIRYQGGRIRFEPLVNGPIMEEILYQPMPELGGRSWVGTFRHQLKAVKQRLNQQGIKPAAILLTGEGSKMGFVRRICAEVFPDSPYKVDREPECSISRGLARWGRGYINTERFLEEINQFAERELPTLIEKETSGLIGSLAEALANGIVEEVLKPRIKAWRNGYIKTLNDLEGDIKSKVESWLKSSAAKELISKQVVSWLDTVQRAVDNATQPIYLRYGLPRGTLDYQAVDLLYVPSNYQNGVIITGPTDLVDCVVSLVISPLSDPIMFLGPIGLIVGLIVLVVGFFVGEEWVKSTNLYQFVRDGVSDDKIEEMGQEQKPQLSKEISEMLNQQPDFKNQIVQSVTQRIKQAMEKQAENRHKLIMFHV